MFSKLLLVAAISLTSAVAYSQETKKEEKKEVTDLSNQNFAYTAFDYIKKTMTFSYHGEYYFTRPDITSTDKDQHDISDARIMHNPTIVYRPTDKWRFLATAEYKYTDALVKGSFPNTYYRSLFSATREKIMTEKEDGMGVSVGIARRNFNEHVAPSYGNNRINTTLTKTFAGKHPASLLIQYLHNDPIAEKLKINPSVSTWRNGYNLLPTITFQITDKLSWLFNDDFIINTPFNANTPNDYTISHDMNIAYINYAWNDNHATYFQLKYVHTDSFEAVRDSSDDLSYFIGHTVAFTPKFSVTGEIGSNMFINSDGRDFFSENIKFPELALYLDIAI